MHKSRVFFYAGLIVLCATIIGLAWAEQISLSTYYPAPYAVYQEFTSYSKTLLAQNAGSCVGVGTDSPAEKVDVSGQIHATGSICTDLGGVICLSPLAAGIKWKHSGAQVLDNVSPPDSWQDIDLSPYGVGSQTIVVLKVKSCAWGATSLAFRPNGDPDSYVISGEASGVTDLLFTDANLVSVVILTTDASGIIEWHKGELIGFGSQIDMWLLGYLE